MSKDPDQDQDHDHDHDLAQKDLQFAVDTARDAFQQVDELTETVERLRDYCRANEDRIAELEDTLNSALDKPYAQLSKREKAIKIQEYAIQRAEKKSTRKHALDYDDVKWSVFDGEASDGHTYNLMQLAAERTGFTQLEDPKRVAVDLDRLNESGERSVLNNATQEVDG